MGHQNSFSSYEINHVKFQMKNCICKIKINNKINATGFFCKIPFPHQSNLLHALIIYNNKNNISKGSKINFTMNNEENSYSILLNESRKIYIDKNKDISIIEINKDDNLKIDSFLNIDENVDKNNFSKFYENKQIYILYYQNEKKVNYSIGFINNIYNNYNIKHNCIIKNRSSGGPIMNLFNFKIIGFHTKDNLGILIKYVINEFIETQRNLKLKNLVKIIKKFLFDIIKKTFLKKIKIGFILNTVNDFDEIKEYSRNKNLMIDISFYKDKEKSIGENIKINNINRDNLTIISKLDLKHFNYKISETEIDNLLEKLELNYIDILILYYRPFINYIEIWKILEKWVLSGKIRKLGLYNFNIEEIKNILNFCKIKPVYYKIKSQFSFYYFLKEFLNLIKELGITILFYHLNNHISFFESNKNKAFIHLFKLNDFKNNKENNEIWEKEFLQNLMEHEKMEKEKQKMTNELDLLKSNQLEEIQDKNIQEFINNLLINYSNICFFMATYVFNQISKNSMTLENLDKNILFKRIIPSWSNVFKINNDLNVYNMCVLDNIMSYNNDIKIDALDYYGFKIKYNELPKYVEYYMKGILELGISKNEIITICLPNTVENILIILALNKLQIISNNVFLAQLIDDFNKYTTEKNSYILITLDGYLQFFSHYFENSKIKKIIVVSLNDFLPDFNKNLFDDSKLIKSNDLKFLTKKEIEKGINECKKYDNIELLYLKDIFNNGKNSNIIIKSEPIDLEKDISYFYTSGSTGEPKCIVFKNKSYSAFLEMNWNYFPSIEKNKFEDKEIFNIKIYDLFKTIKKMNSSIIEPGLRFFSNIKLCHMTGERACVFAPLIHKLTIVVCPIYDERKLYKNIAKLNCNIVFLSGTRLMMGVKLGRIFPIAFKGVKLVVSVGEYINKSNLLQVDEWFKDNGCESFTHVGYGASESGNGTLLNFRISNKNINNEFYYNEEYTKIKIIKENGEEAKINEVGILNVSIPSLADRYLNDPIKTKERWYFDEEGVKWENTYDLAIRKENNSIEILGRNDDYIIENNKKIYFFEKRNLLDFNDPIYEWEISAFFIKNENKHHFIGHIILKENIKDKNSNLIKLFCEKYNLNAVKFYKIFYKKEITEKRDFARLRNDFKDYYCPCDNNFIYKINYLKEGDYIKEKVDINVIDSQNLICQDY